MGNNVSKVAVKGMIGGRGSSGGVLCYDGESGYLGPIWGCSL